MSRSGRLLGLVDLLSGRRSLTVEEIAARLEISIRTAYRDLAELGGPALSGGARTDPAGHERVQIDEVVDPIADVVECTGDDHAPVREAQQHHVVQVFVEDRVHDVLNVRRQRNAGVGQVRSFTYAREAGGEHLMARTPQQWAHFSEAVGTTPGSVNEDYRTVDHDPSLAPLTATLP